MKRRLIDRMRTVKAMLRVSPAYSVTVEGEPMSLPEYGRQLEVSYRDEDKPRAVKLLAVIL